MFSQRIYKIMNIIIKIYFVFIFLNVLNVFANPIERPCLVTDKINWISCDRCFEDKVYLWKTFDNGLSYDNLINNSYILSKNFSNTILKLNTHYLSHLWNQDLWLITNYIPWNTKNLLLFLTKNLKVISHPSIRSISIWKILYKINYVNEVSNSSNYVNFDWNYYTKPHLNDYLGLVNTDLWVLKKYFNLTTVQSKTYCYNFTSSWCWDWVIEWNEECDDWNNISWDWCSSICKTDTAFICWDWVIEWNEECDDWNNISWDWCNSICKTELNSNSAICNNISISWHNITCFWNNNVSSFRLDCWDWTYKFWVWITNWNWEKKANFYCAHYNSPRCFVTKNILSSIASPKQNFSWWKTRNQCIAPLVPHCWDWIIQKNRWEECEKDWYWNFPTICKTNCKLNKNVLKNVISNWELNIINHWKIVFWPIDDLIIQDKQNPFEKIWIKPYIYNNSDYDIFINKLCVKHIFWNNFWVYNNKIYCENINKILNPFSKITFSHTPLFFANKNNINQNDSYWENKIITTLKESWYLYDNFWANLNIRVSKPSIVDIWWWWIFISNTKFISDINNVAISNKNRNKNFVWFWMTDKLSNYSSNINNIDILNNQLDIWNKFNNNLLFIGNNIQPRVWTTNLFSDFSNFNWFKKIFILKNKNFNLINNIPWIFSWARTYIIKNWDFIISHDLSYNDNIAFVVIWWNIIIKSNVEKISWTYISIKKSWIWWNIKWDFSNHTLLITGSVYGNIDALVNNRIKINTQASWLIDVWTIIDFKSKLFRKPAPFISNFISDYIKSTKVAY